MNEINLKYVLCTVWGIWCFVVNKRTGIIEFFSNHVLSLCAIGFFFRQGLHSVVLYEQRSTEGSPSADPWSESSMAAVYQPELIQY